MVFLVGHAKKGLHPKFELIFHTGSGLKKTTKGTFLLKNVYRFVVSEPIHRTKHSASNSKFRYFDAKCLAL